MTATVDLFRIVVAERVYTLTSSDEPVEYDMGDGPPELYVPTPMGRGGVTVKNELTKANLDVRIPLTHALADTLMQSWLEMVVTITVFRKKAAGTAVIWKGRLASTTPDDAFLKMVFESIYTSMRRPGLRARFQKSCRHPLYGRGCLLDPEAFAQAATISAITGRTLTVPEAAGESDGFFTGGMVKATDGTLVFVTKHVGDQLELNRVSSAIANAFAVSGVGTAITIYPGCDHSYATCAAKFANDDNYGGFDYIPTKNPMGGSSIV
jgi:hypothetical protein